MSGLELPLPAEQLVPHRHPMCLIDRLVAAEGLDGRVEAEVAEDCLFLDAQGKLEEVALTELLAQSFAAVKGYADRRDGKAVRQGFLVGIKQVSSLAPVRAGDRLRIEIKTLADLDDFAVAEGEIWCGTTQVASGNLKVWLQ